MCCEFHLHTFQFTDMVEQLVLNDGAVADLEERFRNQSYSDYYVVFLR